MIKQGGQGTVIRLFDHVKKYQVAVKLFVKKNMSERALKAAQLECLLMQELKHRNIMKARNYYEDKHSIQLFMEYRVNDLRDLMNQLNGPLTEELT